MIELNTWVPIEETDITHRGYEGVKVMYTVFDEYTEGNLRTASIKIPIRGWYRE